MAKIDADIILPSTTQDKHDLIKRQKDLGLDDYILRHYQSDNFYVFLRDGTKNFDFMQEIQNKYDKMFHQVTLDLEDKITQELKLEEKKVSEPSNKDKEDGQQTTEGGVDNLIDNLIQKEDDLE
jgi:hypothetical protein